MAAEELLIKAALRDDASAKIVRLRKEMGALNDEVRKSGTATEAQARQMRALDRQYDRAAGQQARYQRGLEATAAAERKAATAAEVAHVALGDADAVSFGDYHVAADIGVALTGEPVDDRGLERLLRPYLGHRYRVQRLLELVGARRERHGPRRSLPSHVPAYARTSRR